MEPLSWKDCLTFTAWIVSGTLALVNRWLHSKFNSLKTDVTVLDAKVTEGLNSMNNKIVQGNTDMLNTKLEAQKSYVERAEYYSMIDRFDRKLERVSDDLGAKIDQVAENVMSLLKK